MKFLMAVSIHDQHTYARVCSIKTKLETQTETYYHKPKAKDETHLLLSTYLKLKISDASNSVKIFLCTKIL